MPFLVAFIISLIIEPVIRGIMKHTKLSRKASSIIVFIISLGIIIGLLVWWIATLISEASGLLHNFNEYVDKCKKLGYFVDELSFDNSYSADNTDGYNVDLDFEEKDCAIRVTIQSPEWTKEWEWGMINGFMWAMW